MPNPRISVVIPTYKEDKYLGRTLSELAKQTADYEIIIADYNPAQEEWLWPYMHKFNIKHVKVDRSGIAYGRHKGIAAAQGEVIVNFDADARYDSAQALGYMAEPILDGRCVLTCCDNIFDLTDLTPSRAG